MAANNLEEISQQILDAITDCVIVTNSQKEILDANDAIFSLFGYKIEEVKGKSILDLTEDSEDRRIAELYVKMLLSAESDDLRIGKIKAIRKDGKVFTCDLNISEVKNGDSTFVLVFHDTSDADQASEALKAQKALVDKALGEADKLRQETIKANERLQAQQTQLQKALNEAQQLRDQEVINKRQIEEFNKQLQAQNAATGAELAKEQEARLKQQNQQTQARFATYLIVLVGVFFLTPYLAGLLKTPESVIEIAKQAILIILGTLGIVAGSLFNAQQNQQQRQGSGVSPGLYNIQPAQGQQPMQQTGMSMQQQPPMSGQTRSTATTPPPVSRSPVSGGRG